MDNGIVQQRVPPCVDRVDQCRLDLHAHVEQLLFLVDHEPEQQLRVERLRMDMCVDMCRDKCVDMRIGMWYDESQKGTAGCGHSDLCTHA